MITLGILRVGFRIIYPDSLDHYVLAHANNSRLITQYIRQPVTYIHILDAYTKLYEKIDKKQLHKAGNKIETLLNTYTEWQIESYLTT